MIYYAIKDIVTGEFLKRKGYTNKWVKYDYDVYETPPYRLISEISNAEIVEVNINPQRKYTGR
jgi:hypothetical protein